MVMNLIHRPLLVLNTIKRDYFKNLLILINIEYIAIKNNLFIFDIKEYF